MAVDTGGVQTGMDVLDPTGNKIGTIKDILAVQAYSATDTDTTYADPLTGAVTDANVATVTPDAGGGQQYLQVDQGGVLGIGAKHLYIPSSAIQNIVPGQSVTVNCTKDTCDNMYGTKPDFLP